MTRTAIQTALDNHTLHVWETFCELYPSLCRFDTPKIVLSYRFTKTAGQCHQSERVIKIAGKFFEKYSRVMLGTILVHELAHQVDYDLFGDSEVKCGHGKHWCAIMTAYGLPANKYHSMEL